MPPGPGFVHARPTGPGQSSGEWRACGRGGGAGDGCPGAALPPAGARPKAGRAMRAPRAGTHADAVRPRGQRPAAAGAAQGRKRGAAPQPAAAGTAPAAARRARLQRRAPSPPSAGLTEAGGRGRRGRRARGGRARPLGWARFHGHERRRDAEGTLLRKNPGGGGQDATRTRASPDFQHAPATRTQAGTRAGQPGWSPRGLPGAPETARRATPGISRHTLQAKRKTQAILVDIDFHFQYSFPCGQAAVFPLRIAP